MAEIVRIVALNEQWLTGGANGISVLIYRSQHLPWIVARLRDRRASCSFS